MLFNDENWLVFKSRVCNMLLKAISASAACITIINYYKQSGEANLNL